MDELHRNLPLYKELGELGFKHRSEESLLWEQDFVCRPNVGLLFDKFLDTWGDDFGFQKPHKEKWASPEAKRGSKLCYYTELRDRYNTPCSELRPLLIQRLKSHRQRRAGLVEALGGRAIEAKTAWRLVSGLGTGHPFEAGFIWHRTLSVPYLPGSSIKGMLRAWAEQWLGVTHEAIRLFGCEEKTDGKCKLQQDSGSLIVFDALPTEVPLLDIDIINCHYKDYYENPGVAHPPADYLSPEPVFFLAVAPGTGFEFALAPRCRDNRCDLDRGFKLLRDALDVLGCGGKTAVGYGHMIIDEIGV